ncbi:Lipoprotein OS=Streptomyces rimosus subsp. rimosus (strain ATCC / DSM 40260 / JCM 4667/ NRRL 2234) OX=1265868 GN=SRIM_031050 PE=4 SV=1 [Streptomyces rimosus subsp. rimosus]
MIPKEPSAGGGGRRRTRTGAVAAAVLAAAALTVGAGGCQDVGAKTANRVELCARIVGKTFTNPFPDDVEKTKKEIRERADELDSMAGQASDEKLRTAIKETARKMRGAEVKGKGSSRTVIGYIADQNALLEDLRKTCLNRDDYK